MVGTFLLNSGIHVWCYLPPINICQNPQTSHWTQSPSSCRSAMGQKKTHCRATGQFQTLKPMVKVLKKKWWVSIVDTKTGFKVPTPKNLSKTYSRSYWNKHVFQQHVGKKTASHYSLSDQVDELVANWKKLSVGCWTRCVFNVLRCPFAQRKETIVYMSSLHDP